MAIFSRSLRQMCAAVLATLFLFSLPLGAQASLMAQQERAFTVYEPNWPKGVIEIKQINNLQSSSFPNDFEVEIKNISNKPIYAIYCVVILPESDGPLGFHLDYGREELIDASQRIKESDEPLPPGESRFLKGSRTWQKDQLAMYKDNDAEYARASSRVVLNFQTLSFGDGTGYTLRTPYKNFNSGYVSGKTNNN